MGSRLILKRCQTVVWVIHARIRHLIIATSPEMPFVIVSNLTNVFALKRDLIVHIIQNR
jgi:hypothetical protein